MNVTMTPRALRGEVVRLGEVLTLVNGRAYAQEELLDHGTPVIRIQNLNGGDRWYFSDLKLSSEKYCENGDLLFAWSGTFGPYFWRGDRSIFHYHIWKVIPSPRLDLRYAYHLLLSLTDAVKAAGRGISMVHMTKGGMEAWEVLLPPLDEQRRIAAILDKADALRQKRKRVVALLDSLTQAIFLEMFGDRHGRSHVLSELVGNTGEFTDGDWVESKDQDPDGEVRLVQLADVGLGTFLNKSNRFLTLKKSRELRCTYLEKNDILIARMPDPLGRACIFPGADQPCVTVVDVCIVRPSSPVALPEWLCAMINSPVFARQLAGWTSGTTRSRISRGNLDKIQFPVPTVAEQQEFVRRIAKVSTLLRHEEEVIRTGESLFISLQRRAFSLQL